MSTIPVVGNPDDPYEYHSGSSVACPIVAGLCGLVKSQHPNWTNTQIIRQVLLTADNIDHLNPEFAGMMGSGRINAYRTLTETELEELSPRIRLFSTVASDTDNGNGDGVFEPEETINVHAVYQNFSLGAATNMIIILDTPDGDLTVEEPTSVIDYFAPDTLMGSTESLSFSIAPNAASHWADLYLHLIADGGYSRSDTFGVFIGRTTLSVVGGMGFPGSTGNIVSVDLLNSVDICVFIFELHFNTEYLSYTNVSRVERSHVCLGPVWNLRQEGVKIWAYDCCGLMDTNSGKSLYGGIKPGTGSIAELTLDVAQDTPLGEYDVTLADGLLMDRPYDEILPDLVDGLFTVVAQGDVNGDGSVNIVDAVLTVNILLGIYQPTQGELSVADCNDDDQVNILDVVCTVNIILGY